MVDGVAGVDWYVGGYTCEKCGVWVPVGAYHACYDPKYRYTWGVSTKLYDNDVVTILKRIERLLERIDRKLE
jgi:hypothetical protein